MTKNKAMVYYRKYRPQTIDDLDSSALREKLNSVFLHNFKEDKKKKQFVLEGDIPHAFLFTGPKGLGKTSTARIVAKVLNCLEIKIEGEQIILCNNTCEPCKSITNGSNLDVLEIDGASNRGIDEIRDLREKVRLAPVLSHKKVYIIDEVHMLTNEAFNALLKTIEEPPAHVVFIFCTTEAHKVPATIISRCFNIPFTVATSGELCRSFERIVKGEKLKVEKGVLPQIAAFADGSFRDGAKILEELALSTNGKEITTKIVEEKYHNSSISQHVSSILNAFANRDTKAAVEIVAKLAEQGIDTKYFLQQVLSALHKMVLVDLGIESSGFRQKLSLTDIQMLVQLLSKAYADTKYAAVEQLPLELAIIAFTSSGQNFVQTLPDKEQKTVQAAEVRQTTQTAHRSQPTDDSILGQLIDKTKIINQSLAGILRGCQIKEWNGKTLVIETKYKFHKDKLDEKTSMQILEKVSAEIAGNKVAVSVLLKE